MIYERSNLSSFDQCFAVSARRDIHRPTYGHKELNSSFTRHSWHACNTNRRYLQQQLAERRSLAGKL